MLHKEITIPDDERLFVIGDIHGKYRYIEKFIKQVNFDDKCQLITCGDIVDRGSDNARLLDLFLTNDKFHSVIGNHEIMMCTPRMRDLWLRHGGDLTYEELGDERHQYYVNRIINEMPYILTINHRGEKYGVTHSGVPYNYNSWNDLIGDKQLNLDSITWGYNSFDTSLNMLYDLSHPSNFSNEYLQLCRNELFIDDITYTIHGHIGVSEPMIAGNRLWIDTYWETNDMTVVEFIDGEPIFIDIKG